MVLRQLLLRFEKLFQAVEEDPSLDHGALVSFFNNTSFSEHSFNEEIVARYFDQEITAVFPVKLTLRTKALLMALLFLINTVRHRRLLVYINSWLYHPRINRWDHSDIGMFYRYLKSLDQSVVTHSKRSFKRLNSASDTQLVFGWAGSGYSQFAADKGIDRIDSCYVDVQCSVRRFLNLKDGKFIPTVKKFNMETFEGLLEGFKVEYGFTLSFNEGSNINACEVNIVRFIRI
jgi:hypothetical protein